MADKKKKAAVPTWKQIYDRLKKNKNRGLDLEKKPKAPKK